MRLQTCFLHPKNTYAATELSHQKHMLIPFHRNYVHILLLFILPLVLR